MKAVTVTERNKPDSNFWVFVGLLCVLLILTMARDISRPFIGLHSLGHAHYAWVARSHLKYGLSYTRGFDTFAVGNPPTKNPSHYLDHPQFFTLLNSAAMAVLGINTWSLRAVNILATIVTLLLFLKIISHLLEPAVVLVAGLLFCLFPMTGYFGVNMWLYPVIFWAIWCYLVLIKALKDAPQPKKFHKWSLAISLFLALQLSWEGFFFALAIGVHYVFRCIHRREFPEKTLLAILIIAPLSSLVLDFTVMAAGYGWNFQRIFELYKWRAGSGEMQRHDWGKWFARFWEFAVMNFSLPVLIIAIFYLTIGQLFVFASATSEKAKTQLSRRFPQFWLFLMPGVFQLFLLKGTLWMHHYWERPLFPLISIAAALGIFVIADILAKIHTRLAKISTALLVAIITISCAKGLNYYYGINHFSPARVKLFTMLNQKIPPDKALLSYEAFIFDQHTAKEASYRPEVAWYLDREIVQATSFAEIQQKAQTGMFPYYLVPAHQQLAPLINQLRQRYKQQFIQGDPGGPDKAPMLPYSIFDLQSSVEKD